MKYELYESTEFNDFILVEYGRPEPQYMSSPYLELIRYVDSYPLDISVESTLKNSYTKLLEFESGNIRRKRDILTELMEEHYPERYV